ALLAHQLLLLVPRVVPLLQPAELGQCRGRSLVKQQGHGLRLLGLRDQHGVAAQHHRLVLQLVAVDPGEDPGQARVGYAVGDPVARCPGRRAGGALLAARPPPRSAPPAAEPRPRPSPAPPRRGGAGVGHGRCQPGGRSRPSARSGARPQRGTPAGAAAGAEELAPLSRPASPPGTRQRGIRLPQTPLNW
uniref:Uncharacterized protein n=1 Tax=Malurus cyaneus samueli TaxID=2593467 RepID=A0A8C5UGV5_9PASS